MAMEVMVLAMLVMVLVMAVVVLVMVVMVVLVTTPPQEQDKAHKRLRRERHFMHPGEARQAGYFY